MTSVDYGHGLAENALFGERSSDFLTQPPSLSRDDFFQIDDYLHSDAAMDSAQRSPPLKSVSPQFELRSPSEHFDFDFDLASLPPPKDPPHSSQSQAVCSSSPVQLDVLPEAHIATLSPEEAHLAYCREVVQRASQSPQRASEELSTRESPRRRDRIAHAFNALRGKSPRKPPMDSFYKDDAFSKEPTMPTFQEWTQRFGQITLQPGQSLPDHSPRDSYHSPQDGSPRYDQPLRLGHRKTLSEQVGKNPHGLGITVPPMTSGGRPGYTPSSAGALQHEFALHEASPRLRQTASWSQPPAQLCRPDYTVSPGELHTTWEDAEYFPPGGASLPTPEYSNPDYSMSYTAYGVPEGQHDFPLAVVPHPHQPAYSTKFVHQPHTPESRSASITPPPPMALPLEPMDESDAVRSHRRRPGLTINAKAGNLRAPKSAGNLRSPTKAGGHGVARDLRSPRSATALKHAKSSGALRGSPTKAGGGGAGFGFVNFTPNDSSRILTGVAPSGSSKTKARRELEAADRKRRLSQAAEKAIREAGGSVDGLRKEGLL